MNGILEQYAGDDFRAYFIIWQNANSASATPTYCAQKRTEYGLTIPTVLFDEGQLATIGLDERHFHFVMRRGGQIVFKRQFEDRMFEGAIQMLLAE